MIESQTYNLENILVLKEKRKIILQTSFELCIYQILKIHPWKLFLTLCAIDLEKIITENYP